MSVTPVLSCEGSSGLTEAGYRKRSPAVRDRLKHALYATLWLYAAYWGVWVCLAVSRGNFGKEMLTIAGIGLYWVAFWFPLTLAAVFAARARGWVIGSGYVLAVGIGVVFSTWSASFGGHSFLPITLVAWFTSLVFVVVLVVRHHTRSAPA